MIICIPLQGTWVSCEAAFDWMRIVITMAEVKSKALERRERATVFARVVGRGSGSAYPESEILSHDKPIL